MKSRPRFVLDTNVLVSTVLIGDSRPAEAFQKARDIGETERIAVCRDPKDDKFLELAVSGQATCIVTSDDDLLALNPFRGIPILSVAQFLKSF